MSLSRRFVSRSLVVATLLLSAFVAADRGVLAGPPCAPSDTNSGCAPLFCDDAGSMCLPHCIQHNPFSGVSTVLDCVCVGQNDCHAELAPGGANSCVVQDDGTFTVHLPPQGCAYISPTGQPMQIINGLNPDMINCAPTLQNFSCALNGICSFLVPIGPICYAPGGSLGGEKSCADSTLNLIMQGTGGLGAFSRNINLPMELEIHAAPRTLAINQSFDTDLVRFFGQILGDPDFDLLRITAGTDFGMPSPGHTTLTLLPAGQWAVDSFFDVTYRIDFVGSNTGQLAGRSGSTTGTIRIVTGGGPTCQGSCPPGFECNRTTTVYASGNFDVCCECIPIPCEPEPDGSACRQSFCGPFQSCAPRCMRLNPTSGQITVTDCECIPSEGCYAEVVAPFVNPCVVPEDGTGTVHLPPQGCAYKSATGQPMQIIDGLAVPDTIDCAPTLQNFSCAANAVCSFAVPNLGICYAPGGSLGGEKSCANSTLNLVMQGTGALGAFNRNINLPIGLEIHTAPRTPFTPVQTFNTDLFRFFGQIANIGDPDFDLLRIVAGTDFGLPSPGQTKLTQLPSGQWAVDSFFDITYRIDFVGAPGGQLAGRSGSTTLTIRLSTGSDIECIGVCPAGYVCHKERTVNPDGSITVCCDCITDCRCRGDMNFDNKVDGLDIQKFADCMVNYFGGPVTPDCVCADMDADGFLSTDIDVNMFVIELVTKPTACPP